MRKRYVIYEKLVTKNIIFIKRAENIGIVSPDMALRYGMTGPNLRGSGIAYDVRKNEPYSVYPEFDFEIPVGEQGDCLDRYMVRVQEIEQSLRIIEQALDRLPDGPVRSKVKKNIKLTPGDCNFAVEAARGELSYYLVGDGTSTPYRLKVRVPSYSNLSCLPELGRGILLSDLVSILGSFDLVIPEMDR